MPDINPFIPQVGQPNSTEEPKVVTALTQLVAAVNNVDTDQIADGTIQATDLASASVTADKLAVALAQQVGATNASNVGRGKAIIPTTEATASLSYIKLASQDQVSNVVLPTDGLLAVAFQALWQETVQGAARAAIFIGSNQLKATQADNRSLVQETSLGNGAQAVNQDVPLASCPWGLTSASNINSNGGYPTTGHAVAGAGAVSASPGTTGSGGQCYIWLPAGTYTVSVQFKVASGIVTVKDRRLWVWSLGF